MGKWEMVKLGDICEKITDGTHQTPIYCDTNNGYVFLSSKNVTTEKIDWDDVKYIPESLHRELYNRLAPRIGDILLAKNGTTGVAALVDRDCMFDIYVSLALLRPRSVINAPYLLKVINSPLTKRQFDSKLKGIGVPNLHLVDIRNTEIPLPPLPIQQKIADVLDRAGVLIEKRKAQIEKLDFLVKSRFVEMFGDPVTNPMGWKKSALKDICLIITDGTHQPPKFTQTGVPFLFVSNIQNGAIDYNTQKFISEDDYITLIKRTPIEVGDILYTIVGSYGNPAVIKKHAKFCFQRHIAYIKPNSTLVNSDYLARSMLTSDFKCQLEQRVRGIAQKTLNLSELKHMEVYVPPLTIQKEFAAFIEHIEAQKVRMKQGLALMELEYKSLMQKCFKGEI